MVAILSTVSGRHRVAPTGDSMLEVYIPRRLWVVPAAGTGASGQQIDGFRFELSYYWALKAENIRLPGGGCQQTLISALHTALEATGTATTVTSLESRPYGEGRGRSFTSD